MIDGNDLGVDVISGISPRSYVAMYKICWEGNGITRASGCSTADSVDAIDDAVADGVDVINYSVGSDTSTVLTAESIAFLGASDAGVFVANSAGNAGPGVGTVGSPASVPWLTTVGADTLHRAFTATVTVNGASGTFTIKGASVTNALGTNPLADAANSAPAGVPAANAELCMPNTLDPAKVTGKIVLCMRGNNARIDKSANVKAAGGVGMILYNASDAQELDTDTHWVPSAHVTNTDGKKVKAAIAAGNATASISQGRADADNQNRVMASFSSRGPEKAVPDLPKPDVVAPGVQILAGAADQPAPTTQLRPGFIFQAIQGTSMASPHVAGAGALLTQANPTLSPAEIKSELMLTANPNVVKEDAKTPADVFDRGSGEIDPNKAVNSGLVLDTTTDDYFSYLKYVGAYTGNDVTAMRPSDLNIASISFSQFAGSDSTTRVFRSIDRTATRWTVSFEGLTGVRPTVSQGQFFTIKPGQSQPLTVNLTRTTAPLNQYASGALVLTSGDGRTLRVPISVKPIQIAAPSRVTVSTAAANGSSTFSIKPGYSGQFSAVGWGLQAPTVQAAKRVSATNCALNPSGSDTGTQLYPFTVPSGAELISGRFANVDNGATTTDLDLFLLRDPNGDGNFSDAVVMGTSAGPSAVEDITQLAQIPGNYAWAVVGCTTPAGGSVYDLYSWLVNDPSGDDPSNPPGLTVTGDGTVTTGVVKNLSLNWSNVAAQGPYLGLISYHATNAPSFATNTIAYTVAEVDKTTTTAPASDRRRRRRSIRASRRPTWSARPPSRRLRRRPATWSRSRGGKPAALTVNGAMVSGRTLTLKLQPGAAGSVRASVMRGKKLVARTTARRVSAKTASVKLRLSRKLARGTYTVKAIATGAGRQQVSRVRLKLTR